MPRVIEPRQLDLVLQHEEGVSRNRHRRYCRTAVHCGTTRNVAEVLLNEFLHRRRVKVTSDRDSRVVRSVVRLEEILDIGQRRSAEIRHRADNRPREWMALRI